jgi:hypothetical protein
MAGVLMARIGVNEVLGVALAALLLGPASGSAAPKKNKKPDEPAPAAEVAPTEPEYGPELPPPPPPPPTTTDAVVVKPSPPRWRFSRGKVIVGARFGGVFAEPFSALGASFLLDVEVGWALPKLPGIGEGLALALDLGYTQPHADGSAVDPRVAVGSGSWDYHLTEHQVWLGVTALYRAPFLHHVLRGRLVPYAGLGTRVALLKSSVTGQASDGTAIGGYVEQSTRWGFVALVGADYALGPGRILFEMTIVATPFEHNVTGGSDSGYLSLQAGYRILL